VERVALWAVAAPILLAGCSMSNFHIGQKVVFIGGKRNGGYRDEIWPEVGCVYTVRAKRYYPDYVAILLVEIVNAPRQYAEGFQEADVDAGCFRPVIERKTDIEVFRRLLVPSKELV
jgi:hypothetical protein